MSKLNWSEAQATELKGIIEGEAQDHLQEEAEAKENMDALAKAADEKFGINKTIFKNISKALFASNIEEKTEAAIQFKQIYIEALGEKDED